MKNKIISHHIISINYLGRRKNFSVSTQSVHGQVWTNDRYLNICPPKKGKHTELKFEFVNHEWRKDLFWIYNLVYWNPQFRFITRNIDAWHSMISHYIYWQQSLVAKFKCYVSVDLMNWRHFFTMLKTLENPS